jgi:hypothetical protein
VKKNTTITFRRFWRGRQPGQVLDTLDYSVAELLVTRGIAAWGASPAESAETAEAPAPRRRARKGGG